MGAYTAALAALVIVLLVVLWMRRPTRRPEADPPRTPEQNIEGFVAGNTELVQVLRERGIDLNAPRHIDVEFYAPSEDAARRLVASLEHVLPGAADVRPADQEPEWAVTYVVQATVSAIVQPEMIERFVRLGDAVGGEYDGWGTPTDTP